MRKKLNVESALFLNIPKRRMQLRSGRRINEPATERLYCSPKSLLKEIYLLDDIDEHHDRDWFLKKVMCTRGNLNYIEEYSREKLLSMDVLWLKNIYCNCVDIITQIIVASYTHDSFSDKTKHEFIRLLFAANKLQKKLGDIIWSLRTDERVVQIIMSKTVEAWGLYRCLRHIISGEYIAYDYHIESYDVGEYTDVELWDYWFAPNVMENANDDLFVKNADHCGEGNIRFCNMRTITI
jgi:hypothetical protein